MKYSDALVRRLAEIGPTEAAICKHNVETMAKLPNAGPKAKLAWHKLGDTIVVITEPDGEQTAMLGSEAD
jgi:hypothetical protein